MGSREVFWGVGGKFTLNPMVECPPQPTWGHCKVMGTLWWVHEPLEWVTAHFGVP